MILWHKLIQILYCDLFTDRKGTAATTIFRNRTNHTKTLKQTLILHLIMQRGRALCPCLPSQPPFQLLQLLNNVLKHRNRLLKDIINMDT